MSDRCYISTRKGLFTVDRRASGWAISRAAFVGDNVTLMMHDPRNGDLFAALNHGHFGIKLHRSRDNAETWSEIPSPQYPPMPEGYAPKPNPFTGKAAEWALKLIWGLAPGGADEPGRHVVRHHAWRTFQIRKQRRFLGTRADSLGSSEA